jgi:hypothetical protein
MNCIKGNSDEMIEIVNELRSGDCSNDHIYSTEV